jgi:N-hydroxyarylamine O-acetyltransferase
MPGIDLDAYLRRIGFAGRARADLATLRDIHRLHADAIPFENLSALVGEPIALDPAALEAKLVRAGRGGWCFEQNLLLAHALEAIGFEVTRLAARVRWNVAPDVETPRSHCLLRVRTEAGDYIADVGFGGQTFTAPLALTPGVEQQTPHERFRLGTVKPGTQSEFGSEVGNRGRSRNSHPAGSLPAGGSRNSDCVPGFRSPNSDCVPGFTVQTSIEGAWQTLYVFDLVPALQADYEVSNWYLAHHPRSHFLAGVVAARAAQDRRHALRHTRYAVHFPDGRTERREVAGASELRELLAGPFGIALERVPGLDARLAALFDARP